MEREQKLIRDVVRAELPELLDSINVDVSWVNPDEIQRLNREHRQIDRPTDVLSFPTYTYEELQTQKAKGKTATQGSKLADEPFLLGSLVLCRDVIEKYAQEEGVSVDERIDWSIRHGLKHLLGFDHDETGSEWWPIR